VLIALNMRGLTTSMSAVLPEITKSTGLSPAGASWLTTVPSLCFGLFGPVAPFLARRLGIERSIFVVLAALLVGTALRDVPAGDAAMQALRQLWQRRGRPSSGLVFPARDSGPQSREAIDYRSYAPLWLIMNVRDSAGHLVYETFRFGSAVEELPI